jgi:capsule polysaccharide export protein KpsC/LpsZ
MVLIINLSGFGDRVYRVNMDNVTIYYDIEEPGSLDKTIMYFVDGDSRTFRESPDDIDLLMQDEVSKQKGN